MTGRGLGLAVTTFTVVPLPVDQDAPVRRSDLIAALYWLPLVGAVLAAAAALPATGLLELSRANAALAALSAVALLALLTRGLHLDGLADVADALGSRAAPERAQQIMHQSDIGPFGVLALVFVVLGQVLALDRCAGGSVWRPLAVLVVGAATSRAAVLLCARVGVPASPASRFGALVAGGVRPGLAAGPVLAVLAGGAALGAATGGRWWFWPVGQVLALGFGLILQRQLVTRLGGISGDVFGAVNELTGLVVLVAVALGGS